MCASNIVGRKKEIEILNSAYNSDKSEFVAIYGRRRVGKSYLVNELFSQKMCFSTVGEYISGVTPKKQKASQLSHFYDSLRSFGLKNQNCAPTCWREAFALLRELLSASRAKRKVVFLDELPWLSGPKSSEFIGELGYFWNSWADSQRNIVLIVCGSATSWMLDNVIRDYGGLYGRLTRKIELKPFTLAECEAFYKKKGFNLSRYDIALSYMTVGGVPAYMDQFSADKTIGENINEFFFSKQSRSSEFADVYAGLYTSSDRYVDLVKTIGSKFYGITRSEIIKMSGIDGGGTLSKMLDNLMASGIIEKFPKYGGARVESVYRLIDFYSLFFIKFMTGKGTRYSSWHSLQHTPAFYNWAGLSFELLVMRHKDQIIDCLRIANVSSCYAWQGKSSDGDGAQIDMVIEWNGERTDYLFEIKFSETPFLIDKSYNIALHNKIGAFVESRQHNKIHSVQLIMLTTMGLNKNSYRECVNRDLTLDVLFGFQPN